MGIRLHIAQSLYNVHTSHQYHASGAGGSPASRDLPGVNHDGEQRDWCQAAHGGDRRDVSREEGLFPHRCCTGVASITSSFSPLLYYSPSLLPASFLTIPLPPLHSFPLSSLPLLRLLARFPSTLTNSKWTSCLSVGTRSTVPRG